MGKGVITGLAHIGVFVKDIDVSIDYYKRLGFTLDKEESIGVKLAFLSAGTCLVELVEQKDLDKRAAGPVDHVAVVVDDIEKAIDLLVNAQIRATEWTDEYTIGHMNERDKTLLETYLAQNRRAE